MISQTTILWIQKQICQFNYSSSAAGVTLGSQQICIYFSESAPITPASEADITTDRPEYVERLKKQELCKAVKNSYDNDRNLEFYISETLGVCQDSPTLGLV